MSLSRRGFLRGMAGILAAGFAPAVIGSGVLMPVRKIITSTNPLFGGDRGFYDGLQWDADQLDALRPYPQTITLNQIRDCKRILEKKRLRPVRINGEEFYVVIDGRFSS